MPRIEDVSDSKGTRVRMRIRMHVCIWAILYRICQKLSKSPSTYLNMYVIYPNIKLYGQGLL